MKKTIISLIIGSSIISSTQVIAMEEDQEDLFTKNISYVVPVKEIISFIKRSSVFPDSLNDFHKQHVFTIGNNAFMISNVWGGDNFLDKIPQETCLTFAWQKNALEHEKYGPGFQSSQILIYKNGDYKTTEDVENIASYHTTDPSERKMIVNTFFSSALKNNESALNWFTVRPHTLQDK